MSVYKPKPVSGFPEWLPEERLIEQQWFDHIRRVFESYGFCSIETPSVEELDVIRAKGEVDKEIYVLERLHKEDGESKEARLALHFDQTVPLARYVAQHFSNLVFPFKRYQIQRVWRGERPQAGRFREFYQCDIDVINVDALPLHFDAEMPAIIWEVLSGLPGMAGEKIQLRVSNRKILIGLCEALGIQNIAEVTRIIDKLEKIGKEEVSSLLSRQGLTNEQCNIVMNLASFQTSNSKKLKEYLAAILSSLPPSIPPASGGEDSAAAESGGDALMQKGIEELSFVLDQLSHLPEGAVVADLSIVRGLDYYTGTVYETVFTDDPGYGSICSGGRYDDLASSYINKKLPGVGISIGFSRLFDRLRQKGKFDTSRKSPAAILMVLPDEEQRPLAAETARILRGRGFNVELYHAPKKTGDQIKYALKKGIPYVWFPDTGEVKCLTTQTQEKADPASWQMPKEPNP